MKAQKTVEVEANAQAVMDALVGIADATKKALADGWQAGQDIPAIVGAAWASLPAAIAAFPHLKEDEQEDVRAFIRTLGMGVGDLAGLLLQK